MLQTMYAEEDAEDERLLAELIELRLQAAERELQHSQRMLAAWQDLLDEVTLTRRTIQAQCDALCSAARGRSER
jgi:hypothetical protein